MAGSRALWQAQDKISALRPPNLGSLPSTSMVLRPSLAVFSSPGWGGVGEWLEKEREENSSPCSSPRWQLGLLLRRTDVSPNGKCTCFSLAWGEGGR